MHGALYIQYYIHTTLSTAHYISHSLHSPLYTQHNAPAGTGPQGRGRRDAVGLGGYSALRGVVWRVRGGVCGAFCACMGIGTQSSARVCTMWLYRYTTATASWCGRVHNVHCRAYRGAVPIQRVTVSHARDRAYASIYALQYHGVAISRRSRRDMVLTQL